LHLDTTTCVSQKSTLPPSTISVNTILFEVPKSRSEFQHTMSITGIEKRRTVTFSSLALVKTVLHIDDYSEEERQRCWYSHEEIKHIKRTNQQLVNIHKVATQDQSILREIRKDENLDCRGLEQYLPSSAMVNRSEARQRSRHLVLQESFFARHRNEEQRTTQSSWTAVNEFELAQAYKEACYKAKMLAYMRGINDAQSAKNAYKPVSKVFRTSASSTLCTPKHPLVRRQINSIAA